MTNENEMILSIADLQSAASKKLPTPYRDFFNSGSTNQITLRENATAFSKYRLRPRVLRDVSTVRTDAVVFGKPVKFPLCISPAGLQAMAHPDGELATSRACARVGVNMGVSSFANYPVEEIVAAGRAVGPIAHAMQMYTLKDRAIEESLIRRAEAAGCKAIFLTADSPVLGWRYNEKRSDFRIPTHLRLPMLDELYSQVHGANHSDSFASLNSDAHTWAQEIPWLRSVTQMEIWIKGVLTAEDVELAIEHGCDGVLVSNHGGRQLDDVPATIDVLPDCARAARGRIRLHVDGGIRSGSDIFKALALGAECCWVGRPALWGLAYNGQEGVELMLNTLYDEFKHCMQLTGCKSVADITPACIGVVRTDGPLARL